MTDLDTQVRAKQPEHDEQARLLADFMARGGQIERLPRGAMAESGWTARQLINPQVHTKAMRLEEIEATREGLKRDSMSRPLPKAVKEASPPRLRGKGPGAAQPGTMQHETLEVLQAGPMTCRQIAEAKGWKPILTAQRLDKLKRDGLVRSYGKRPRMMWELAK